MDRNLTNISGCASLQLDLPGFSKVIPHETNELMKLPHESFGDTIERLCKNFSANNLTKWFETTEGWANMSEEEYNEVSGAIMKFRKELKPPEL